MSKRQLLSMNDVNDSYRSNVKNIEHPALRNLTSNRFPVDDKFIKVHNSSSIINRTKLISIGRDILNKIKKDLSPNYIRKSLKKTNEAFLVASQMLYCEGTLCEEVLTLLISIIPYMPLLEKSVTTYAYIFSIVVFHMVTEIQFQPHLTKQIILWISYGRLLAEHLFMHYLMGHLLQPDVLKVDQYIIHLDDVIKVFTTLPSLMADLEYLKEFVVFFYHPEAQQNKRTSLFSRTIHLQQNLNVKDSAYDWQHINHLAECCALLPSDNLLYSAIAFDLLSLQAKTKVNVFVTLQFLAIGTTILANDNINESSHLNVSSIMPLIPENKNACLYDDNDKIKVTDVSDVSNDNQYPTLKSQSDSIQMSIKTRSKTLFGGVGNWDWRLAMHYVKTLGSIVLRTTDKQIKKLALVGRHVCATDALLAKGDFTGGLIELASFRSCADSWLIRYASVLQLKTIAANDRDEKVCTLCSNILKRIQIYEVDDRVLQAFTFFELFGKTSNTELSSKRKLHKLSSFLVK